MKLISKIPERSRAGEPEVHDVLPGEAATVRAAQAALEGGRRGPRALWPFLGPAFIAEKRRIQRFERIDVVIAMSIAGAVNISMLAIAASVFFGLGLESIEDAFRSFESELGRTAAVLFGIALLASGFSSSSVGTMAGQVVMQGFINRRIPLFLRRAITLTPALVVLGFGANPSRSLVLSQVVLSFGIPFALIPLVVFTSRRTLMGGLANSRLTNVVATGVAIIIVSLNLFLLYETFFGA